MEDKDLTALIVFLCVPVGFILLVNLVAWATRFSRRLRYINMEIGRTSGEERRYWIRKKRQLWLSILPFVGRRKEN